MSIVLNVALFGRPSAGPVIASTSSTCRSRWRALEDPDPVERDVIPMKPGESLATTTPLPSRSSANRSTASRPIGRCRRRNRFKKPKVARRVEEVRAQQVPAEVVDRPSASAAMEMARISS